MAILDEATMTGAFESLKGVYTAALGEASQALPNVSPFVDTMTGTGKSVTIDWMKMAPALRKWIGSRENRRLGGDTYTVTNVPYEATVEIDQIDLTTDQFGLILPAVRGMARESARFVMRRMAAVLMAADSTVCADGQYLVDSDHIGDKDDSWSNKGTSALSASTLEVALYTGAEVTDKNGDPAGISYDTLMVPPRLRSTAEQLCYSQGLPGSANNDINPYRGLNVIVNPFFTEVDWWFLLDSKAPVKPFLHTVASGMDFGTIEEDRTRLFDTGSVFYGVSGWSEVHAYFPQGIYGGIV